MMKTIGSRAEVFHGKAEKTSGGLKRHHLTLGKDGRIKSKKASSVAKKAFAKMKPALKRKFRDNRFVQGGDKLRMRDIK
jgi:hypothetical protein